MIRKLHKDDSGVAMIMALIVGVVVMAFCLSLLLVTYTLYAQTARKNAQMQCKVLAQSYVECLRTELADPDSDMVKYLQYKMTDTSSPYGVWTATNASADDIALLTGRGLDPYEVLQLEIDASGYWLNLFMTYQAGVDDGEGGEEGEEPDDEFEGDADTAEPEENQAEAERQNSPLARVGTGGAKSRVSIKIQCVRGLETDRDKQVYTIEEEYWIPSP
ncbi:MAG: hypothetical protein ACI4EX_04325 [Lachnospiraceae bacterium]